MYSQSGFFSVQYIQYEIVKQYTNDAHDKNRFLQDTLQNFSDYSARVEAYYLYDVLLHNHHTLPHIEFHPGVNE